MRINGFSSRRTVLQRSKLSTLMLVCFLGLNLIVLLAIIGLAYRSFSDAAFTEISKARLALLNESTNRGFDFITDITSTAYSVVSNKEVKEQLESAPESKYDALVRRRELSDLLHHMLVVNTGISSIEIYTDVYNEVPYSATDLVFPIRNLKENAWFGGLGQADAVWIPDSESASSHSLIGYAQHMFDSKGKTMGYLVIRMSQQAVLGNFADVPLVLEGQVLIVDTAGNVIVKVNEPKYGNEEPVLDKEWLDRQARNGDDGYEVIRKGDRSYLALYTKPTSIHWRLVQTIPTSALLASTYKAGWYVLWIGLFGLLLSGLLAYLFVYNMIRPLRRLMMEMKRLERGDFNAQATSAFTEEYAQLSYSFNHMVSRIKDAMEHVRRENKAKRDAQTSLLEAQIKPHFLYNTLDMIHWRALDYKAQDISQMITQLGKLLRIGLSGGQIFIRVRDELEHARCYIGIQKERLPFSIKYEEVIEPETRGYFIPKIILQPLIENAVIHGKPEEAADTLHIRLTVKRLSLPGQRPVLELALLDNGKGLPENWRMENATGIGIRNVQQRIQLYCGSVYGLQAENAANGGVRVVIRLPIIETDEQLKRMLDGESG